MENPRGFSRNETIAKHVGNNMKTLILIAILILTFSCADEKKCLDFKTGEFVYVDKSMPERIIRNDSMQIEINPKTGVEIYTSIKWISDCEYVLTYKKILNHPNDVSYMIGKKILVDIISTKENKYTAFVKSDNVKSLIEFKQIK